MEYDLQSIHKKHLILSLKNYYFDIFLKAVELTRERENM